MCVQVERTLTTGVKTAVRRTISSTFYLPKRKKKKNERTYTEFAESIACTTSRGASLTPVSMHYSGTAMPYCQHLSPMLQQQYLGPFPQPFPVESQSVPKKKSVWVNDMLSLMSSVTNAAN